MGFHFFKAAIVFALLPVEAMGACSYCTNRVVLTQDMATCLSKKIDGEIARLMKARPPVGIVTLADCSGIPESMRGGQSMPNGPAEPLPTISMLTDSQSLTCLKNLIQDKDVDWTPAAIFLLGESCK